MPMTLYFKRAKNFVQSDDNGTKKFLAQPSPNPESRVPFWVADTPTYKQGIKDGSIINLTPPAQMPGYKAEPVVEEPTAAELNAADAAEEADSEQTEVPQAPFGAQPMTPVSPAPKIGRVSAGSGRSK